MPDREPVLCYIDESGKWAWFTTCELAKQPGEKWDSEWRGLDASEPLEWAEHRNLPPYELTLIGFRLATWSTPKDTYSVECINRGGVPWLNPWGWDDLAIWAGTPLSEFKRLIRENGGEVYTRED